MEQETKKYIKFNIATIWNLTSYLYNYQKLLLYFEN